MVRSVAAALIVLALAAALAPSPAGAQSGAAGPVEHVVSMSENPFRWEPRVLNVSVGDTVRWINDGRQDHYVCSHPCDEDPAFESRGTIKPGASFPVVFDRPGEYLAFCYLHTDVYGGVIPGKEWTLVRVRLPDDTGDNDAPRVHFIRPLNDTIVWGLVTFEGAVLDPDGPDDIKRVAIRFDQGDWRDVALEPGDTVLRWTYRVNATELDIGTHVVDVRAMDDGFVRHTASIRVEVPATPPATGAYGNELPLVRIDAPTADAVLWRPAVVRGTARDHDGDVLLVELRFDEGPWIRANGTGSWHYGLQPERLGEGPHVLEARAFDGLDHSFATLVPFAVRPAGEAADDPPADEGAADDGNGSPGAPALAVALIGAVAALLATRRRRS